MVGQAGEEVAPSFPPSMRCLPRTNHSLNTTPQDSSDGSQQNIQNIHSFILFPSDLSIMPHRNSGNGSGGEDSNPGAITMQAQQRLEKVRLDDFNLCL